DPNANGAWVLVSQDNGLFYQEFDADGKVTLLYDKVAGEYKTYTWGATDVTVDVYMGAYAGAVVPAERDATYIYTHNDEFTDLDSTTNNAWVPLQKLTYDDNGTSILITENYYSSGLLHETIYANSAANPNGDDLYYERENYDFYGNGQYGRIVRTQTSDGHVYKTYSFHAGTDKKDEVEEYTTRAETTLYNVYWHYNDSDNRVEQKISYNNQYGDYGTSYQYYNNSSNRMEIKWSNEDIGGNMYDVIYRHTDESWLGDGYGRQEWKIIPGIGPYNLFYYTSYYAGTWQPQFSSGYQWSGSIYNFALTDQYSNPKTNGDHDWQYITTYYTNGAAGVPATLAWNPNNYPEPVRSGTSSMVFEEEIEAIDEENALMPEGLEFFYEELDALKDVSTGLGVSVAILDSGVDASAVNVIGGYDFAGSDRTDGVSDEDYTDSTGHGTVTASIVSATASEAEVLVAKVFDDAGRTTTSIVADAIRYAVDSGAKILATPFSLFPVYHQVEEAINYALDAGVIFITAAGNDSMDIPDDSLAGKDGIITVGSVDADGHFSAWSNCDDELDLLAPWDVVEIESADDQAGTSYSAALVAGIAALMLEEDSDLTSNDILAQIKAMTAGIEEEADLEEEIEERKIRGVNVDEIASRNAAITESNSQRTGYGIIEDVPSNIIGE
ncbi:MAG: S8 family serine peptidase, partial [Candidatus Tantalella remota]|nr:S8 family serine peptidase [Candidatus Tantalella remota]